MFCYRCSLISADTVEIGRIPVVGSSCIYIVVSSLRNVERRSGNLCKRLSSQLRRHSCGCAIYFGQFGAAIEGVVLDIVISFGSRVVVSEGRGEVNILKVRASDEALLTDSRNPFRYGDVLETRAGIEGFLSQSGQRGGKGHG